MQYFTTTSKASRRAVDCVIVGIYERGKLGAGAADIDAASKGSIKRLIKSGDLSGGLGSCTILNDVAGVRAPRVAVVGLGKSTAFGVKQFRVALSTALHAISKTNSKQVLNCLTLESASDANVYYLARHTAQTATDVLYRFTQMKSNRKQATSSLAHIGFAISKRSDAAKMMLGVKHGDAIGMGMSLAKDLGNLPANICTPGYIARAAQKLARENTKLQGASPLVTIHVKSNV
jgi:leucyl aminopeptidase